MWPLIKLFITDKISNWYKAKKYIGKYYSIDLEEWYNRRIEPTPFYKGEIITPYPGWSNNILLIKVIDWEFSKGEFRCESILILPTSMERHDAFNRVSLEMIQHSGKQIQEDEWVLNLI
jgi:hypothetical protein